MARKGHLAMNTATSDIRAMEFTPGRNRQKRNAARHTDLWQGVLEALDPIPCKTPDQGMRRVRKQSGRLFSRRLDAVPQSLRRPHRRKTAEIQIRVAPMNRFSALGTAEIVRMG